MAGHNKWSKIKHKKAATDAKKSSLFSKHIAAISVAARENSNPDANPSLRAAIDRAKAAKVPSINIENALNKAAERKNLQELLLEAYGPENVGILIATRTDNSNRTIAELKKLLSDSGAKFADQGSVLWAFEKGPKETWAAKFPQELSAESGVVLGKALRKLEEHPDVEQVFSSAA